MKMTNYWNRSINHLSAQIYDEMVNHFFLHVREQVLRLLNLKLGEPLILVEVSTIYRERQQ
jgi:hypothetical protein